MAADPEVISSVDFDDGTTGTWTQSGSPTLTFVDDGAGGQALSILRAQDFEGIQSPTGLLELDVVYTFSMRARLPEGTAGTTDVRLVVKPAFNWVANTTINGSGWTTISGTYTVPAGTDPAATQVYVGSAQQTAPYTILVDDILITAPAAPPPTVTVLSTDFEDGLDGWVPRGDAQGDPTVTLTTDESHSPHACGPRVRSHIAGRRHRPRRHGDHGPGTTYVITAWVKFAAGNPTDTLWLSMRRTNGGTDSFDTLGQFTAVSGTTFVEVTATYAMGEADSAFIYFESRYPDGTTRAIPRRRHHRRVAGAAGRRGPDRRSRTRSTSRLAARSTRARPPAPVGAPAPALRPGHAREPHEARGLVRRRADLPDPSRGPGDHGLRPGQRDTRLRPHARLAQPDAGLVLPARRRRLR